MGIIPKMGQLSIFGNLLPKWELTKKFALYKKESTFPNLLNFFNK